MTSGLLQYFECNRNGEDWMSMPNSFIALIATAVRILFLITSPFSIDTLFRSMPQFLTLRLVVLSLYLLKLTSSATHSCITWAPLIILRKNTLFLTVVLPHSSGMILRRSPSSVYWSTADPPSVMGYLVRRKRNNRRVLMISWQAWICSTFLRFMTSCIWNLYH